MQFKLDKCYIIKSRGSEPEQQEYILSRRVIQNELTRKGIFSRVSSVKPSEPSSCSSTPAQKARRDWVNQRRGYKSGEGITFLHEPGHFFIWSTVLSHLFTQKRALLPWSRHSLSQPDWHFLTYEGCLEWGICSEKKQTLSSNQIKSPRWWKSGAVLTALWHVTCNQSRTPSAPGTVKLAARQLSGWGFADSNFQGLVSQIPQRAAFVRLLKSMNPLAQCFTSWSQEADSWENEKTRHHDQSQSLLFSKASVTTPSNWTARL